MEKTTLLPLFKRYQKTLDFPICPAISNPNCLRMHHYTESATALQLCPIPQPGNKNYMKYFLTCLIAIVLATPLVAVETEINSTVESVTIYHSGALVSRNASPNLKPGKHELVFKNLSSKIILNSLKVSNREVTVLNKTLVRKLSEEEQKQLLDRQSMLRNQLGLIESKYQEAGFISKVEDLEKMMAFYESKILQLKQELRSVKRDIATAQKLENIQLDNEDAAILKLVISLESPLSGPFQLQYVCGGIGWSPAYEIAVESASESTIGLKYLAKTMSQTGENWNEVTIRLSSAFPLADPTSLPKPESPWTLKGGSYGYNAGKKKTTEQSQNQGIKRLDGVEYQEIKIPSFLKVRTLKGKFSLQSNSTVFTFPIQTVNLPANYYYYGFPGLDSESYLVAEITDWSAFGFVDGVANIRFNNTELGKSILKFSESKDTLLLPIGRDNSLFLKREEIADQKYFKVTNIGKKRVITYAYRYQVKNNNAFPVQYELADQIPVSQTKMAKVEVKKNSNAMLNNETGELVWRITLKPGESVEKELVFTLEMDANYGYNQNARMHRKFKTISAPKF